MKSLSSFCQTICISIYWEENLTWCKPELQWSLWLPFLRVEAENWPSASRAPTSSSAVPVRTDFEAANEHSLTLWKNRNSWSHGVIPNNYTVDLIESFCASSYVGLQMESLSPFNLQTPNGLVSPHCDIVIDVTRCDPHSLPPSDATASELLLCFQKYNLLYGKMLCYQNFCVNWRLTITVIRV